MTHFLEHLDSFSNSDLITSSMRVLNKSLIDSVSMAAHSLYVAFHTLMTCSAISLLMNAFVSHRA
uniref:Uncharacterized protein n=1 Tax=Lepeophtheirus salmonis TaxID=72036 RepID=A0A0K2TLG7_LEPSM